MTPLQEKIFEQEYDRLINQPVNKITELELKYMREFFRINYAEIEIENRITDLENAMLEEENKMDLYKVFQHGLNAESEWEHVLSEFCVDYDKNSNIHFVQTESNRLLERMEKEEERRIAEYSESLNRTKFNRIVNVLKKMAFQIDADTGSSIIMSYFGLYRSFHCIKQKYMLNFLKLGYQSKGNFYFPQPFYLSSDYVYTRRVVPDRLLTKELLDNETERVIAEINGYAGRYGKQLNEERFRSIYRFLLETSLQDEAKLELKGDTTIGIIWLRFNSVLLRIRPDMFGPDM